MTIVSAKFELAGQSGMTPKVVYIETTDDYKTVTSPGYLQSLNAELYPLSVNQMALVSIVEGSTVYPEFFRVAKVGGQWSLVKAGGNNSGADANVVTITASGTYNVPAKAQSLFVQCIGGGGSGGGTTGTWPYQIGQGGGAGGYAQAFLNVSNLPSSIPVVVGAGGIGVPGPGAGGNGSITMFGTYCEATGGLAGSSNFGDPAEGIGGIGTVGDVLTAGSQGRFASVLVSLPIIGNMYYSGRGAPSFLGAGGRSLAGNNATFDADGEDGPSFGSGGGGGLGIAAAKEGGDGKQGIVIVTEYY